MLLSPGKNGLDSLFKDVRVFKVQAIMPPLISGPLPLLRETSLVCTAAGAITCKPSHALAWSQPMLER